MHAPWADLRGVDGADDRIRTGDPNLGKVVLYQLSHVRAQGVDYHGLPRACNRVPGGRATGVWRIGMSLLQ